MVASRLGQRYINVHIGVRGSCQVCMHAEFSLRALPSAVASALHRVGGMMHEPDAYK